jgi:hypothetical protein
VLARFFANFDESFFTFCEKGSRAMSLIHWKDYLSIV